jgi:hypothetical protein
MVGLTCRSAKDAPQRVPTNENQNAAGSNSSRVFLFNFHVKNA